MKPNSHDNSFSDEDPTFDDFFEIREMAPTDFATRTIGAVRARKRRARIYRFTACTTAAAAVIALFLGVTAFFNTDSDFSQTATAPADFRTEQPLEYANVPEFVESAGLPSSFDPATPTADELTALLYAAIAESDTMFYGHAWELENLLEDAVAISNEETLQTLDMLFLLAQH